MAPNTPKNRWLPPLLALFLCGCATRGADSITFVAVPPNPNGQLDRLYAVVGDIAGSERQINNRGVPSELATSHLQPGDTRQLRLLHINDMHHHLADIDANGPLYNAARISHWVKQARIKAGENDIVLFVSAGDDTTGTTFDNLLGKTPRNFIQHAGYQVYSAIGMDVAVLGNHEFDWGTDILTRAVKVSAAFPVVSSNIVTGNTHWPVHNALVGLANGVRFAFIGLTPPGELPNDMLQKQGYKVLRPDRALPRLVRMLEPYADIFIVLSHLGYDGDAADTQPARQNDFFGDTQVANMLSTLTDKPALVVGGHTHTVLNATQLEPENLVNGIPVLQAGEYGRWLGQLNAVYTQTHSGLNPVYTASLIAIAAPPTGASAAYDQDLQTTVIEPLIQANPVARGSIGQVVVTPALTWARTAIDRYTGEAAIANLITDAVVARSAHWDRGGVDFATYNSTGIQGGFAHSGDITVADIHKILPYPDSIQVVELSGRELKSIIESNAQRLQRRQAFTPAGAALDPTQHHETGFLHFSSRIRYTVVLPSETGRLPAAEDIEIDGQPISDVLDKPYRLALPRFLAIGRGKWSGDGVRIEGLPISITPSLPAYVKRSAYDTGRIPRDEVQAHIATQGTVSAEQGAVKDGRLRIAR